MRTHVRVRYVLTLALLPTFLWHPTALLRVRLLTSGRACRKVDANTSLLSTIVGDCANSIALLSAVLWDSRVRYS